uniref:C2H2-type domain-containing protein n=1 Tax=Anopheles maculatus TaxID=74869 RepID=A0A182S8Z3_9DIPT
MLQNFLYNEDPDRFEEDQIADCYSVAESEEREERETDTGELELSEQQQTTFVEESEHHTEKPNDCLQGEKSDLTAVEFILQKIGTKRESKPRSDNRSTVRTAKHACTLCEKTFLRRSNLIDHLRLHAKVKMYECDYCDKRFVQSGNLKSHLRIHTAEKPFECSICGKTFAQSSSLKTHMLTHTNVKPYVCDVCDKGFTSSSDLNKHKRTHTGVKPYQCIICPDRQFTQKVHLRNHLARMHPTSNISEAIELGDFHTEKRTLV